VSCQVEHFQGTVGVHQTPRKPGRYAGHLTLSPGDPIPGSLCCVSAHARNGTPVKAHASRTRCLDPVKDAAKQLAVPLRETVKQEREPSLGPPSPSPGSFALPLSTGRFFTAANCHNPCPGPGILTWFPFADRCDALREEGDADHMRNAFLRRPPTRPTPDRTPLYGPYPIA
jgi:hypothetical protein